MLDDGKCTAIENDGEEYTNNMEKLIVLTSIYKPFKIGKIT